MGADCCGNSMTSICLHNGRKVSKLTVTTMLLTNVGPLILFNAEPVRVLELREIESQYDLLFLLVA